MSGELWVVETKLKGDSEWIFQSAHAEYETAKLCIDPMFCSPKMKYRVVQYLRNS